MRGPPRPLALLLGVFVMSSATPAGAETGPTVIDGAGGGGGRIEGRVAEDTATIVRHGVAWIFYGANPEYGYRLRLARLGVSPHFRTLDGRGGANGRTEHSVATDVSAIVYRGVPHVFYRDEVDGTLRHAWRDGEWRFEVLDGNTSVGDRTAHDVGRFSMPVVSDGQLTVVYRDDTTDGIRLASFDGSRWMRRRLVRGPVDDGHVAAVWNGALHVVWSTPEGATVAQIAPDGTQSEATLLACCRAPTAVQVVSDDEVLLGGNWWWAHLEAGTWTQGSTWIHVESFVVDDGVVHAAGRYRQCYGSGGCDNTLALLPWDGTAFPSDAFEGSVFSCCDTGVASSAATIDGVGRFVIGGVAEPVAPYVRLRVLGLVEGPFE